jgi:DNA polymerase I-like protein with 3'-5' exonuclease and polymerase domains
MVSGSFCKVSFAQVSITSPVQVKEFLLEQGWKPREFTPKGSPKMTVKNQYQETVPCPSLDEIDTPVGQLLARRGKLKHRVGIIFGIRKKDHKLTGVLNLMRSDGRVEAGAMTNATNTGRMAHRGIVNVPKPKDKLWKSGIQLRELFIVEEGKLMMGIDADGLEARMEAHSCLPYRGGEAYAYDLIDGDVHAKNAVFFGTDRDGAKAPKYALTYGCQPAKLATTVGCSLAKAKRMHRQFWGGNTALSGFKDAITKYWKGKGESKYIKGIDGRKIWIRSEHSITNAYFQSTGSITVKVAALFLDKWLRQRDMDSQQLICYHDELEVEVPPEEKEIVAELSAKAFVKSGEYLKLRVPVTGTPKFGNNWKEVH